MALTILHFINILPLSELPILLDTLLYILLSFAVLLKFMEKNNRRPATKYTEADVKELLDLKSEVLSTLKVSKTDIVPEAFAR